MEAAEQIAGYRVQEVLHHGPLTRVFRAIDSQGREVAIKEFLGKQKIFAEVSALFSVTHPHLIGCLDLIWGAPGNYLVFEYSPQGSLRRRLEQGPLSQESLMQLAYQCLAGLGHAHQAGWIHRDLKPENILCWDDHFKLADFGQAGPEFRGHSGTPAYMAPEQFSGRTSVASDLYSLGIIFWEAWLGERPFQGDYRELQEAHAAGVDFQRLKTLPAAWRQLLTGLLAVDPNDRWQSAAQALLCLQAQTDTLGATVPPAAGAEGWRSHSPVLHLRRLAVDSARHLGVFRNQREWRIAYSDGDRARHVAEDFTRPQSFQEGFENLIFLEQAERVVLARKKELRCLESGQTRARRLAAIERGPQRLFWDSDRQRLLAASEDSLSCWDLQGRRCWQHRLSNYGAPLQLALLPMGWVAVTVGPQPSRLLFFDLLDGKVEGQLELPGSCLALQAYAGGLALLTCPMEDWGKAGPGWLRWRGQQCEVIAELPPGVYQARALGAGFSLWRRGYPSLLCTCDGKPVCPVPTVGRILDDCWVAATRTYAWLEQEKGRPTALRCLELGQPVSQVEEDECTFSWSSIQWTA